MGPIGLNTLYDLLDLLVIYVFENLFIKSSTYKCINVDEITDYVELVTLDDKAHL